MNIENLTTLESLDQFLQGNRSIAFSVLGDKTERYQFTQKILVKFTYQTCSKQDKGLITFPHENDGVFAPTDHSIDRTAQA
jgi:hypothetical protein